MPTARTSFFAAVNGQRRVIATGQQVDQGDPVVAGREHLFDGVEQPKPAKKKAAAKSKNDGDGEA